ncbi:hypothetical protein, partial [Desulfovibrio legallii]|uniref:hypothetical protein n=1 Tax=Desulfovibrio legallii TaxID=571438 RepID=UPI0022E093E0
YISKGYTVFPCIPFLIWWPPDDQSAQKFWRSKRARWSASYVASHNIRMYVMQKQNVQTHTTEDQHRKALRKRLPVLYA